MEFEPGSTGEKRMQNVVQSGDRLQMLETMLEMLAERFDKAAPRDSSALSRQIQLVMEDIDKIRADEGDTVDELDLLEQGFL
jgi:hypothetical protein